MTATMGTKSMREQRAGIITTGIVVLALVTSLVILVAAVTKPVFSQESGGKVTTPLVVPIFPRSDEDNKKPSLDSDKKMPAGADLRDSYIVMEDGSVISMADWVLGGLSKNSTGVGMSDYQNRLFLGQVARAMAGQGEDLIYRSVVDAGPARRYHPGPKQSLASQLGQFVLAQFVPGLFFDMPDYDPSKMGGGFDPRERTAGEGAIQFDGQFHDAYDLSNGEFHERGTMMNMLRDYEKADAAENDSGN